MSSLSLSALLMSGALCALAPAALAQTPTTPVVTETAAGQRMTTYAPAYFDTYQPSNAMDMIYNVPSFGFNGGDQMRGFAGNAGNVLIDGQRPATKDYLGNIVSSIPASQVERIEHIVGGAPGIDMHGHTEVVNVVRRDSSSVVLNAVYRSFNNYVGKPAFNVTWTKNEGEKKTLLMFEAFEFRDNGAETNTLRRTWTPDHTSVPEIMRIPQIAGGTGTLAKVELTRPFLEGNLSFNASINPVDYDSDIEYITASQTAVEHVDWKEIPSEFGLKYERRFNDKLSFDVNWLTRHRRESTDSRYIEPTGNSRYNAVTVTDEQILGGTLIWQKSSKWSVRAGSETVFNSLERDSTFSRNGVVQGVPNAQTRVEEERIETFVSSNWQIQSGLSLDAAIRVESSAISVPTDGRSESFVYPKPKVQLVWSPSKALKITMRSERIVQQLSFDDFASSVELQSEVISAGNTQLIPQKQWVSGVSADYTFWEKGSLSFGYEYHSINDTLDNIAIITPDGAYNARGNIGDATGHIWNASVTVPLDRFRFKGGQFKANYTNKTSSVIDPITGRTREISGVDPEDFYISLSQSLTKHRISWGIEGGTWGYDNSFAATDYYTYRSEPWASAWVEYKTTNNLTMTLSADSIFGGKMVGGRTNFTGLRDLSPVRFEQETVSYRSPSLTFRVRKEI